MRTFFVYLIKSSAMLHNFRDPGSSRLPLFSCLLCMIKLNLEGISVKKASAYCPPRRPAWYKADQTHVDTYTCVLSEKLAELDMPGELDCQDPHCTVAEHRQARDSFLLDVLISMIEASHTAIPMGGGKKKRTDPSKSCVVEKSIPGWREEIEPLRQDSLSWHSLWQSSGRPNSGNLYQVMKQARQGTSIIMLFENAKMLQTPSELKSCLRQQSQGMLIFSGK